LHLVGILFAHIGTSWNKEEHSQ